MKQPDTSRRKGHEVGLAATPGPQKEQVRQPLPLSRGFGQSFGMQARMV